VEISSVTVEDRAQLDHMAPGVADAIARGAAAFRPTYVVPANPESGHDPAEMAMVFLAALFLAVVIAAIYLPILRRNIKQAAKLQQRTEEQARRELTQPTVIIQPIQESKAKLITGSGADDGPCRQ